MQEAPSGGENWNQCKWRHLVAKLITNASCANFWPHLQENQVAPSGCHIYNQYKYKYLVAKLGTDTCEANFKLISVRKNDFSFRINTLGPFMSVSGILRNIID